MSVVRNFQKVLVGAVCLSAMGVGLNTLLPRIPISICINLLSLLIIYRNAEKHVQIKAAGFDPVVASEAMVAFGVFSLVTGLGSIILALGFGRIDPGAVVAFDIWAFLPFIEGLLTAGIAPLGAIALRMRVAELEEDVDATGDLADLAKATSNLTMQMKSAATAIDAMKSGASSAGAATVGLATSMKGEADKWGIALQEGQAHVKTFGEAARNGSSEVSQLATATSELKKTTAEVSTLMEELARLITAVERFVEPRSKKP